MALVETPQVQTGWKAADFKLPGTDGKTYSLADVKGENGLVVMFICNHCPFVKAIMEKLIRDVNELKTHGINVIGISSNDVAEYPDDSFENMKKLAKEQNLPFPYVYDETQDVAKTYGAVCTPDFFGFNNKLELQYRGRLDDSGREKREGGKRDLFEAMVEIAKTGQSTIRQYNSIGCNIKWKE